MQKILTEAALSVDDVAKEFTPTVFQGNVQGSCINYTLAFSIFDYQHANLVSNDIRSIAWYKLHREGLVFPFGSGSTDQTVPTRSLDEQHISIASFIRNLEIFSALSTEEVEKLAKLANLDVYSREERLFNQGDMGDSLYIVCSGSVAIYIKQTFTDNIVTEKKVSTLTAGSIIGEISLLTGAPRSASVVVSEESELILINRAAFKEILVNNPAIAESLTDIMLKRQAKDMQRKQDAESQDDHQQQRNTLLFKIKSFFQL